MSVDKFDVFEGLLWKPSNFNLIFNWQRLMIYVRHLQISYRPKGNNENLLNLIEHLTERMISETIGLTSDILKSFMEIYTIEGKYQ